VTLINPPPIITQLSTQLQACAAWVSAGLSTNVWYPEAPENTAGPYAVLGFGRQGFVKYAEGAAPVREGELFFTIWKADTIGNLETLAQAIVAQVMTQDTGIPFRDGEGMNSTDLGNARIAGSETLLGVSGTLTHGLTP
jgi:hypothetical protein